MLKELPPKMYQVQEVELYKEQAELYKQVLNEAKIFIGDKSFNVPNALTKLTRCIQVCAGLEVLGGKVCSAKADELEKLLDDIIYDGSEGHKVIVFSQFTDVIDKVLAPRFMKYNPAIIAGSGDFEVKGSKKRANIIDKFQLDDTCKLFIGSTHACKEGITLTAATTEIMFDLPLEPGTFDQATDRAHRIGQLNSVLVISMVAKGTIENNVYELIGNKRKLRDYLVDKEKGIPMEELEKRLSLTREDIRLLV